MRGRVVVLSLYLLFVALPIYWLVNMSLKTNAEITSSLTLWPRDRPHLRQLHEDLHRFELVLGLYQLSAIRDS
jgi:ABC-type glycerol-3-phosphate transport system permease component